MRKIIILDFNRTLYDPDSRALFSGTAGGLQELLGLGFELYLISYAAPSRRLLIRDLGIEKYFAGLFVSKQKTRADFETLIPADTDRAASYVIGDRVKKEIRIGNELGMRTVWLRRGLFAEELPSEDIEKPEFTVRDLKEFIDSLAV